MHPHKHYVYIMFMLLLIYKFIRCNAYCGYILPTEDFSVYFYFTGNQASSKGDGGRGKKLTIIAARLSLAKTELNRA